MNTLGNLLFRPRVLLPSVLCLSVMAGVAWGTVLLCGPFDGAEPEKNRAERISLARTKKTQRIPPAGAFQRLPVALCAGSLSDEALEQPRTAAESKRPKVGPAHKFPRLRSLFRLRLDQRLGASRTLASLRVLRI